MFSQGYWIDSQICVVVLWAIYALLLHRRIDLRVSRAYLLLFVPAGMLLPLLKLPLLPAVEPVSAVWIDPSMLLPYAAPEPIVAVTPAVDWNEVFRWIYLSGAAVMLLWLGWDVLRAFRKLFSTRAHRRQIDGLQVVFDPSAKGAYSLFGTVFVGEAYNDPAALPQLLAHERTHVRKKHSRDLLVANLYRCLLWFNPAVWNSRKLLREVHEFQADQTVIRQGGSIDRYLDLLIDAESGLCPSVGSPFCYSLTKKRIAMMHQTLQASKRSNRRLWWSILPACLVLLGSFSLTARAYENPVDPLYNATFTAESSDTLELNLVSPPQPQPAEQSVDGTAPKQLTMLDLDVKPIGDSSQVAKKVQLVGYRAVNIPATVQEDPVTKFNWEFVLNSPLPQEGQPVRYTVTLTPKTEQKAQPVSHTVTATTTFSHVFDTVVVTGRKPIYVLDGQIMPDYQGISQVFKENKITQVTVLKGIAATEAYGPSAADGALVFSTKEEPKNVRAKSVSSDVEFTDAVSQLLGKSTKNGADPIYVIDGKIMPKEEFASSLSTAGSKRRVVFDGDDYESITVLKGAAATQLYGEQANGGAIVIKTKSSGNTKKGFAVSMPSGGDSKAN